MGVGRGMGRGRGRRVREEAPVAALPRCSPLTVETVRSRWFASGLREPALLGGMGGRGASAESSEERGWLRGAQGRAGRGNPSAEREARTEAREELGHVLLSDSRKSRQKRWRRAALGL